MLSQTIRKLKATDFKYLRNSREIEIMSKYLSLILLSIKFSTFIATESISSGNRNDRTGTAVDTNTLYYQGNTSLVGTDNSKIEADINKTVSVMKVYFADGMISVDCLRCLCLKQSNCKPIGCNMRYSLLQCGYFQITNAIWIDCGKLGSDWKKCANDVLCSSQCLQNYMKRYAERYNCVLKCEGYTRELFGGPNGCNNPVTLYSWDAVQKVPGCKGVE